jgi:hypothetical protein
LLKKQDELNTVFDLDKGERQVAAEEAGEPEERDDMPSPARGTAWSTRETPRRRRVYKGPTLRPGL